MHRAPAVSFLAARSRWHLRCIVVLAASSVLALVGFGLGQPQSQWQVLAVTCVMPASALVALIAWRRSPVGGLRWDGQHWRWSGWGDAAACRLTLRMDWQNGVLVSLICEGERSVCLWLDAPADPAHWNALRRAIFSSQNLAPEEDGQVGDPHEEVA